MPDKEPHIRPGWRRRLVARGARWLQRVRAWEEEEEEEPQAECLERLRTRELLERLRRLLS